MRLLHISSASFSRPTLPRAFLLLGSLCLVLSGCASKNPLIDDMPAVSAKTTTPAPATTAAATAAPTAAATGAQTSGPTGIRRVLGIFSPYKIDIQQGNFVSKEMISQLREGMTQDQVRFVLGTPMLSDIFHADQWYYPFVIRKGNGEVTSSRVTVYFKNGLMERFEGGDLPTEQDYLKRISGAASKDSPAPAPSK